MKEMTYSLTETQDCIQIEKIYYRFFQNGENQIKERTGWERI
jgi:hypothetical protein